MVLVPGVGTAGGLVALVPNERRGEGEICIACNIPNQRVFHRGNIGRLRMAYHHGCVRDHQQQRKGQTLARLLSSLSSLSSMQEDAP
eukprot:180373-Amphidinium_carterae.1